MKRTISASVLRSLVTPSILVSSLLVAFLYLSILFYTPNFRLLLTLLTNDYPLLSKLTIVGNLFLGGFLTQSPFGLVLLLLTAILIGLNIVLLTRSFHSFRKNSKAHIAVGGSMVLGFVGTSCAVVCGFSLLPLIGTTLGASFFILDGMVFRLVTIILLTGSLLYTLSNMRPALGKKH